MPLVRADQQPFGDHMIAHGIEQCVATGSRIEMNGLVEREHLENISMRTVAGRWIGGKYLMIPLFVFRS